MSVIIEQDLKEILTEIRQKLDTLQKDVTDLKVGQVRLEEKTEGMSREIAGLKDDLKEVENSLKDDIKEVKNSQKAQIWALIGVLGTAVIGTVIRFVITALPMSQ